jgi:hypothetical protein
MTIKKYYSTSDTIITNAFRPGLRLRATGSNIGQCDILETFYIAKRASLSSSEIARTLIYFPMTDIISDRTSGDIPASGNVNFYLSLTNAEHPFTLPRNFTLQVSPLSRSFEEGIGMDMDNYVDLTYGGQGANWINASSGTQWTTEGGDFLSEPLFSQSFSEGYEDLEVNITDLVEQWISGTITNNGVGIHLTSSQETGSTSFYTKRFFGRGTEYFFRRPAIEAKWDASVKDDRGKFVISSSLLTSIENLNTIYLYNYYNGILRNIPSIGTGSIYVNFYTSSNGNTGSLINSSAVTGGYVSTGIYSASTALVTSEEVIYDVWFSGSYVFHTGTIEPVNYNISAVNPTTQQYISNISNLKNLYASDEIARFRLYSRLKNWSPTIYEVANANIENNIVEDAYYKIIRTTDSLVIIPYGTGSEQSTKMSYDVSGNYFDFDMSLLEKGYSYGIKVLFKFQNNYEEQPNTWKFRVDDIY